MNTDDPMCFEQKQAETLKRNQIGVDLQLSLKIYPVDLFSNPGVILSFLDIEWELFKGWDFQDRWKNFFKI